MTSSPNEPEVHICGILVQARPADVASLSATIGALPRVELATATATGRLVVVAECDDAAAAVALIDRLRALPGVLNVALVYQHAESAGAMEEEFTDETDPPRVH